MQPPKIRGQTGLQLSVPSNNRCREDVLRNTDNCESFRHFFSPDPRPDHNSVVMLSLFQDRPGQSRLWRGQFRFAGKQEIGLEERVRKFGLTRPDLFPSCEAASLPRTFFRASLPRACEPHFRRCFSPHHFCSCSSPRTADPQRSTSFSCSYEPHTCYHVPRFLKKPRSRNKFGMTVLQVIMARFWPEFGSFNC